ncbi:MAG: helix-turn-helix transcriptional regulator [Spirochaetales bacterium]|nr:helix-turn-helix transcriptional regulator [Spirochaetales bacterium]
MKRIFCEPYPEKSMANSKLSPIACVLIDGEKIRNIRQERGLTQLYVATCLEITTDTVSRWENKRSPSIKQENAEKLAEVLEVELAEITQDFDPAVASDSISSPGCGEDEEEIAQPISTKGLWVMPLLMVLLVLGWLGYRFQHSGVAVVPDVTAERLLPKHGSPHLPFPVVIRLHATEASATSFILRESFPETCVVSNGIPPFTAQSRGGVKWIHTTGTEDLYFGYLASPVSRPNDGDKLVFDGVLLVDNVKQRVAGATTIEMVDYHWADRNNDYRIYDSEILAIYSSYDLFKQMGVDIDTIQQIWAGKGYRWDIDSKSFAVVSEATVSGGE